MARKTILQGDQYNVSMSISVNGEPLTDSDVSDVEVTIEGLSYKKTKSGGEVTYSDNHWWFPLTREETFSLKGRCDVEVRVLMNNNEIYGQIIEGINFQEGLSKEILS